MKMFKIDRVLILCESYLICGGLKSTRGMWRRMELVFLFELQDFPPRPDNARGELDVMSEPPGALDGWTGTALIRADSDTSWVIP